LTHVVMIARSFVDTLHYKIHSLVMGASLVLAAGGRVSVFEILLSAEAAFKVLASVLFDGVHYILLHLIAYGR